MEHLYSVTPLLEDHFDERVKDIVDQYKRGVTTCPLMMMVLVPEGNPVWNKVDRLCELYARYRDALAAEGVPAGVLVQATFGHGNSSTAPAPFQRMIGFADGKEQPVYCPMDDDTLDHLSYAMKRIAMEHPKAIMLDDDVRLLMRPFDGCVCPLHMKEFNRMTEKSMTREELRSYVMAHPDDDPLTLKYVELQRQTLVKAVTRFREAIDSVDPTIQGINCTSGDECDAVIYTNPIFAGKGNPTIVRSPNGTYAPLTTKGFSDTMRRAAVCGSKLRNHGIDIVLAETDTIQFNRYSKNARYLHSHMTASILEGLRGTKHWITRTRGYEMKSGKAFRDILAKHRPFYDELASITEGIRFVGANSAFIEQVNHPFHVEKPAHKWRYHPNKWAENVFERMGIPFYYSDRCEKISFLEDRIVRDMSDEQIENVFRGSVVCSIDAALDVIARGYGHLLGVDIEEPDERMRNGETFDGTPYTVCGMQVGSKKIVPRSENVEILSNIFGRVDGGIRIISPAVTLYEREGGVFSVVYSGTPDTNYTYTEAFSMLNETRKKQLLSLIKRAGDLPIYADTDNEICLRAGYVKTGELLAALFIIGHDPEETVRLYLEKEPSEIKKLLPSGSYESISFEHLGDSIYELEVTLEPMYPLVLLIK